MEGIEADRRAAKNYYRYAFMARGPRGEVSLPEAFWEPPRNLPGNSVTRHPFHNLWYTFDTFDSGNLQGIFWELLEGGILAFLREGRESFSGNLPGTFQELLGPQEKIMLQKHRCHQ